MFKSGISILYTTFWFHHMYGGMGEPTPIYRYQCWMKLAQVSSYCYAICKWMKASGVHLSDEELCTYLDSICSVAKRSGKRGRGVAISVTSSLSYSIVNDFRAQSLSLLHPSDMNEGGLATKWHCRQTWSRGETVSDSITIEGLLLIQRDRETYKYG